MKKIALMFIVILLIAIPLQARRNIMMTGYWAPTSEMIYRFSDDPELNPDGWIGENWEDSGYDVYAFFPAFNRQTRDFEVDYQATWEDFWATVEEYNPIAIISYGAGAGPWEMEYTARNLSYWVNDYEYPYQPTPCPPDDTVPVNFERHSTLPLEEIEAAVDEQTQLNAWIDWNGNPGAFLCEYIAYLGMWYQDMHSDYTEENYCLAAGFTHVNAGVNLGYATEAAEVTLRTTIEYLQNFTEVYGTVYAEGVSAAGTTINIENENGTTYSAVADENGEFYFNFISAGEYQISAFLDRYFYYEGTAYIDVINNELEITLEEYSQNEQFNYCSDIPQLFNAGASMNLITAAVYPPEELVPYLDCHLRELIFKAPADSTDCTINMILYEGMPGDAMLILLEEEITSFSEGDDIHWWIDDLDLLTEDSWENGLTLALQIDSDTGNIGWVDEGPAVSGYGNMIKVSGVWMESSDMLGLDANWYLGLGFYGTMITDSDEVIISASNQVYNYPNPFNPETSICFQLSNQDNIEISIYNIKGELVKNYPKKRYDSGLNQVVWNGYDQSNKAVSSGIYFYKISADSWNTAHKMLLLK